MEIRSAIPFAYLLLAAFLIGAAVAGAWLIAHAVRRRKLRRGLGGLALLLASAGVAVTNVLAEGATDLNPRIASEAVLRGVWTAPHVALEVRDRGQYVCRGTGCGEVGASGRWARVGDFEVELVPDIIGHATAHRPLRLRVIERHGRLQLTRAFSDPDTWDGEILVEQIPPAG